MRKYTLFAQVGLAVTLSSVLASPALAGSASAPSGHDASPADRTGIQPDEAIRSCGLSEYLAAVKDLKCINIGTYADGSDACLGSWGEANLIHHHCTVPYSNRVGIWFTLPEADKDGQIHAYLKDGTRVQTVRLDGSTTDACVGLKDKAERERVLEFKDCSVAADKSLTWTHQSVNGRSKLKTQASADSPYCLEGALGMPCSESPDQLLTIVPAIAG